MNNHQWYKSMGLCVECGRERPFYGRKYCPGCIEKYTNRQHERRANMTEDELREYRRKAAERQRKCRERKKAAGTCLCCPRQAVEGSRYCTDCRIKKRRADEERRKKGVKHYRERGLCLWCGSERVPGKSFCRDCLAKKQETMALNGSKRDMKAHLWAKDNRLIRAKGEKA